MRIEPAIGREVLVGKRIERLRQTLSLFQWHRQIPGWMALLFLLLLASPEGLQGSDLRQPAVLDGTIETILQDFRLELGISAEVIFTIESTNPRLVSVRRHHEQSEAFLLSFDSGFVEGLDEEELRAVIAHELGHVWIFTNHPFLQTESLANRKAMQLVSRESLERVYEKVWRQTDVEERLSHLLGDIQPAER